MIAFKYFLVVLLTSFILLSPGVSLAAAHEHGMHHTGHTAAKTPAGLFEELTFLLNDIANRFNDFFAGKKVLGKKTEVMLTEKDLYNNIKRSCPTLGYDCLAKYLREITKERGLKMASNVLRELKNHTTEDRYFHQLGHEIGKQAAETYGFNSQLFFECPISEFNAGCQHGFFTYALNKGSTIKETVESICEQAPAKQTQETYANCYHGAGHGIMMANDYDLDKAVNDCNQLANPTAQIRCLDGAFMEGATNLIKAETVDIKKAQDFCLQAPEGLVQKSCFRRIGWQIKLQLVKKELVTQACNQLEKREYRLECDEGASVASEFLGQ